MKKTFLSQAMTSVAILLLASALHAQTGEANQPTPGTSKVRIVRLSQVRGAVEIDRSDGRGFEPAIANLPVIEKNRLRTGVGVAEVEFEDNSSLRLAPNSVVEFPVLERNASGATASSVHVIQGTAYVSLVKPQSSKMPANAFALIFGSRQLNLDPATHIRLELAGSEAKLAVLDGLVHVEGGNGLASVTKKKTATFQIFDQNEPTVAKDIATTPFDAWDHTAASYHSNVASMSAFNSPYAYGLSDMSYYGNFINAGGCGSMWRPYFASAGWNPYSNGTFAYYPGSGYSWVSPYPWAWTPYHSGSWAYCDNVGWGWMPGGGWYGLNNVAALAPGGGVVNKGPVQFPHPPGRPPLPHQPSLISVNTRPLAASEIASSNSFVFRKDSAGLGVPRETLGNLGKFSQQAVSRGTASTPIYVSAPATGRQNGGMTMSESMAISVHRGFAPSPTSRSSDGQFNSSFGSSRTSSSNSGAGSSSRVSSGITTTAPSAPSVGGGVRK